MDSRELSDTVEQAKSLVKKILSDIPGVHDLCVSTNGLTLDPSSEVKNLQYMVTILGIPTAPTLKALSADFTLDMCLGRMSDGLQLFQDLLGAVKGHVTSNPEKVTDLLADIRDLLAQVQKMQELLQVSATGVEPGSSDLASRLTGDYEVQVATHLSLKRLRSFAQDVFRSLRNIAQTRPRK